jgi:hypothetical protein
MQHCRALTQGVLAAVLAILEIVVACLTKSSPKVYLYNILFYNVYTRWFCLIKCQVHSKRVFSIALCCQTVPYRTMHTWCNS